MELSVVKQSETGYQETCAEIPHNHEIAQHQLVLTGDDALGEDFIYQFANGLLVFQHLTVDDLGLNRFEVKWLLNSEGRCRSLHHCAAE